MQITLECKELCNLLQLHNPTTGGQLSFYSLVVAITKSLHMFFNQTFENVRDRKQYDEIIKQVGWFFFDLFVLGYVEDPITGKSFQLPMGMSWRVYVEVCKQCIMLDDLGTFSCNVLFTELCMYILRFQPRNWSAI